jgi:hypothetical protein
MLSLCLTNYTLRLDGVWGSGCVEPHFLDFDISWRVSGHLHTQAALSPVKKNLVTIG